MTSLQPHATPVIMYHSIGVRNSRWLWSGLTMPFRFFERQISLLSGRGYRGISLSQWLETARGKAGGSARRVALTFDDGYLDNWVFAYPLLERYGWRGTVYVNPEFVDPSEELRPTLHDVWAGRCGIADLQTDGFLNWGELKALRRSGVLEIGSHSMTHTWYPTGSTIVDYHRPGGRHPWLSWNARPDRKHAYLTEDQDSFVPYGTPVYEHGRSLGIRRYFPDPELDAACVAYVAGHGGREFFGRPDWRRRLDRVVRKRGPCQDRYESDHEMLARYAWEIGESRRVLSERLDADVVHFCWPGGAYNDASWKLAAEQRFLTICVNRVDTTSRCDSELVSRMGCHGAVTMFGRQFEVDDPSLLYDACEIYRGSSWRRWTLRGKKLVAACGHYLSRSRRAKP